MGRRVEVKPGLVVAAHDPFARCSHRRVVAVIGSRVAYSVGDDKAPRLCSRRQLLAWARRQGRFSWEAR